MSEFDEKTLVYLRALSAQYRNVETTLAAIAARRAELTLPTATVHVISDIHGDYQKLTHVINNASGSLRPLVEDTFGDRLSDPEKLELLNLIYYPRETYEVVNQRFADREDRLEYVFVAASRLLELLRQLAQNYSLEAVERVFPADYRTLLEELLVVPMLARRTDFLRSGLEAFVAHGRELNFLRVLARAIRNLLISELIVAGDFGDRGQRIDKAIAVVMRQPRVAVTWGNHDVSWMGACLGQEACIATVLRISLRYQRLFQLEMGYGIPIASIEKLARTVYHDDPATQFRVHGSGIRDPLTMARMQKALTVILLKLEAQTIRRNPQWQLEHRNLLHWRDPSRGTVEMEGREHALLDAHFPTLDPSDPYALSPEEKECMDRMRHSFLQSPTLWEQMRYLMRKGGMWLRRDQNLIFHGCVPVDEAGEFLSLPVGGQSLSGRALYDALTREVQGAFRHGGQSQLDLLWYLWCGPRSPLFGKDKIATFERHFLAAPQTHVETQNPYFRLIHDRAFCQKILAEFGLDPAEGLIVNGHVPVKIEAGESPMKRSGQAVTIDGAFSQVYGDQGYTLVLNSQGTYLARHHHFESVSDAIHRGADIIPVIETLRTFQVSRAAGDTDQGDKIRAEIEALELLMRAYEENVLPEAD